MTNERRFSGTLTTEYDLFDLACPHGDVIDAHITRAIRRFRFRGSPVIIEGLELGFGTGLTTKAILAARSGIQLTALDSEPGMLPKAKRALASVVSQGSFRLLVADALAFLWESPPRRYDFVATAATFHNFPARYRQAVWSQLSRIVKVGGLFVNADKYAQDEVAQRKAIKSAWIAISASPSRAGRFDWLQSVVEHYMADESPVRRMDEKTEIELMRRSGFHSIRKLYRKDMTAIYLAKKA